jgi:type IV pilus assembly protein PilY1
MWRFDVNDTIGTAGREATLIGTAKTSGGTPTAQPITTRPELALNGSSPFVMFGTGKMLGTGDLTNTQGQSIYGVVDPLTAGTSYTDLRGSLKPLTMTQVGSGATATRTIACGGSTADCNLANGWVVNLPDAGERVNVDMKLQLGTLVVASNVPENSACTIGGYSWLNYVNYSTGMAVANSTGGAASQKLSDSLAVGLNIVRLPDGRTVVITTTSDAKQTTIGAPFDTPSPIGKRISWREISQ